MSRANHQLERGGIKQEKDWNWKEQATAIGMSDQYEFIYSFTSRLLHATPVSLTTNQKLLEPEEMRIFLEYIYVSLLDILRLAKEDSRRTYRSRYKALKK